MFIMCKMRALESGHVVWVYRGPHIKRFTEIGLLGSVLSVICVQSVSISSQGFWLRLPGVTLVFEHAGNTCDGLRFEDRRQRNFHTIRCGAQLGPEEFPLADAHGPGLL